MILKTFKGDKSNAVIAELLLLQLDQNKTYDLEIKEHKEKRSIKANNYSWLLTDKLAEKLLVAGVKLSKEQMHAEMIFRYGQVMYDADGQQVVMSTAQGVSFPEFYPYSKEIGESETNGKLFTHYRIYRGSHEYNKEEMSLFIKGIVEECREQSIETKTPDEIANMISLMKEEQ